MRNGSAASLRRQIAALTKQALELRGKRQFMRSKAQEARALGGQEATAGGEAGAAEAVPGPSQRQALECPVCFCEAKEDIHIFSACGHAFCKDCANKLVLEGGTCAVCRHKVTRKQVFRVAGAGAGISSSQRTAPLDPDAAKLQSVNVVGEWSIKVLCCVRGAHSSSWLCASPVVWSFSAAPLVACRSWLWCAASCTWLPPCPRRRQASKSFCWQPCAVHLLKVGQLQDVLNSA